MFVEIGFLSHLDLASSQVVILPQAVSIRPTLYHGKKKAFIQIKIDGIV